MRLNCHYDQSPALRDVSIEVKQGEIVTLLGPNGAGKSTLLRAASGLLRPSSGHIVFDGHEITKAPAKRIVRLGLSHVPEGRRLFPGLTVLENLEMGAEGSSSSSMRGRAISARPMASICCRRPLKAHAICCWRAPGTGNKRKTSSRSYH